MLQRLLFVVVIFGSVGVAAAQRPWIVVEAYNGERPPDAEKLIQPLRDELAKMAYVVEPEKIQAMLRDKHLVAPITDGLPEDFVQQYDAGHAEYANGNYRPALDKLVPLVDRARNNTGEFALDQSKRDVIRRSLIDIGMAYKRLGDINGSKRAFRDLVASFADQPVLRAQHGNDAADAWDDAKKDIGGAKGKIEVETGDQQAAVYINERQIDIGTKVVHEVPPGQYRVVLKLGGQQLSRVRVVEVADRGTTRVAIHTGLEKALRVSNEWVGLVFGPGVKRSAYEGIFAKVLADQLDAASIVVIGVDDVNSRPHVMAALIQLTDGADMKRGSLLASGASESERRELARFATGKQPTATGNIVDLTKKPEKLPWGGWKYLTGVGAVAGLGLGAYLLSIHNTCSTDVTPCPDLHNTQGYGFVSLGVGAVLTGFTVYFVKKALTKPPPVRGTLVYAGPTSGGALVGVAGRF